MNDTDVAAKKELYWANHRLEHARKRLDELGLLSQLRRQRRQEKTATLDRFGTFTNDVRRAEAKIAHWEHTVEELGPEVDRGQQWDADHGWPDSRLRTVDDELAELDQPAHQHLTREASLLSRALQTDRPAWLDRTAEIAPPPLPSHDLGAGIDIGP